VRALIVTLLLAYQPWSPGVKGTGIDPYTPPSGISRDSGSSFPVVSGENNTTDHTDFVSGSFATSASSGLCIVAFSGGDQSDNQTLSSQVTIAWSSQPGTATAWTKRACSVHTGEVGCFWTATWSGGGFTSRTVTVTQSVGVGNHSASLMVDCLNNVNASPIGNSGVNSGDTGAFGTSTVSGGVTSGSWVYTASGVEGGGTSATTSNVTTVRSDVYVANQIIAHIGINTTASGALTAGITNSGAQSASAIQEILP
jgi:hypothetical protein